MTRGLFLPFGLDVITSKHTKEPLFIGNKLIIPESQNEEFKAIKSKTGFIEYLERNIKPDKDGKKKLLVIKAPFPDLIGKHRDFVSEAFPFE